MKYAKRMVLIPEQLMDMLERKESMQTQPTTKSLVRLDKKMDDILINDNTASDDKLRQYNQNLQRFLDVQQQKRQYVPTVKLHQETSAKQPSEETPNDKDTTTPVLSEPRSAQSTVTQKQMPERDILDSIPQNSRSLARTMINRLKANRDMITWNDKGEITINDNPIPGSNIIDLVNDQLRARKNFNPVGWEQFTESLDRMNMPKYLMRNEKRRSHVAELKNETPKSSVPQYMLPPTPPATPNPEKKSRRFKPKRLSPNWIRF